MRVFLFRGKVFIYFQLACGLFLLWYRATFETDVNALPPFRSRSLSALAKDKKGSSVVGVNFIDFGLSL